ncbi:hypothetical protein G6O67_008635 [Ophiocordyceps sinensis]|uniref:Uncharacterized protein n=2 Tax=Ophiocordyceps sinensis TaxID=72228 RepID=A0A8H4LRD4_9HYPO|nr:hypothetical protein OCS_02596 [Ophiocordyceps sinensis CO18]KAF4504013.1 hypothetical protein G6O67_008635 [Ophiocordyceps sinensis]
MMSNATPAGSSASAEKYLSQTMDSCIRHLSADPPNYTEAWRCAQCAKTWAERENRPTILASVKSLLAMFPDETGEQELTLSRGDAAEKQGEEA